MKKGIYILLIALLFGCCPRITETSKTGTELISVKHDTITVTKTEPKIITVDNSKTFTVYQTIELIDTLISPYNDSGRQYEVKIKREANIDSGKLKPHYGIDIIAPPDSLFRITKTNTITQYIARPWYELPIALLIGLVVGFIITLKLK